MKKYLLLPILALCSLASANARADMADDFHRLQDGTETALLDLYEGNPQTGQQLGMAWKALAADLGPGDAAAHALVPRDFTGSGTELAAKLGASRAALQHIAALETMENQKAGREEDAQAWRVLITLPQFADADDGGLLLHQAQDASRQPGVTQALAKEYLSWQVSRVRQLTDYLQRAMEQDAASDEFVAANLAEIATLSQFPPSLMDAAGLKAPAGPALATPSISQPYAGAEAAAQFAAWRGKLDATLPNLLKPEDVTRLQRLLVRFVGVIPKEYHNGVQTAGTILIPLEYQEAVQFTQQAQGLVNELSPVWQRDMAKPYSEYHGDLVAKLADLSRRISRIEPPENIDTAAKAAGSVLEDKFGLSARRSGDRAEVVEETALDVRDALSNSLAAAQAGHWQEAESLRLDAYTSFDAEIEPRVLPRDPSLARLTERSFIDGTGDDLGLKALLDRAAPIDQLTAAYSRVLKNTDACVAILKVSISPATVGFTAFTVIAREGLEAIIVLAALLAGMRGPEQSGTRRWVSTGAWLAIVASGITFWLSRTLIQSLSRYGEKLEAVVSILAVAILLMVTNWIFHKFYWTGWNAKLRSLSKASQNTAGQLEWMALLGVGFLTVYREGFETTLFMQSLLLEGSLWPVVIGAVAGGCFITCIGMGIFTFGAKLPYRKLLVMTGVLVISIMVTFFGSTVRLFQTVGWMPVHPVPHLEIPGWAGLWLGLYPSWEGLLIPPLALVYVICAWLWVKFSSRITAPAPAPMPAAETLQARKVFPPIAA